LLFQFYCQVEGCEIFISAILLLRRIDKRKDRVEISVEQLSNASTAAEISFLFNFSWLLSLQYWTLCDRLFHSYGI